VLGDIGIELVAFGGGFFLRSRGRSDVCGAAASRPCRALDLPAAGMAGLGYYVRRSL